MVQGLVEGTYVRGRPSRTWLDDISDWGGEDVNTLARKAQDRPLWKTTLKKPREVHNCRMWKTLRIGAVDINGNSHDAVMMMMYVQLV